MIIVFLVLIAMFGCLSKDKPRPETIGDAFKNFPPASHLAESCCSCDKLCDDGSWVKCSQDCE